ncbi:MAG: c-type cytochrome [Ardenticatenaceae bacterium]|nr:c-type cytochrome [Ardenticatenaceae bacterium]
MMQYKRHFWLIGLGLCLIALGWGLEPTKAANDESVETAVSTAPHPDYNIAASTNRQQTAGECDIYAVDLIGAWVDAGAMDGNFPFTSLNDEACTGDFTTDVLPLFTTEGAWFEGSQACTECHFDNSEDSRHEMNLGSYAGIMLGGDVLSDPPGVAIVIPGNWSDSKLRARLRNNRMPPGWEFDIEETNRDGPLLEHDGGNVYAVELIGAWVNAGAPEGDFAWTDTDGSEHNGTFESDVLPLFTTEDAWFEGSQACTECHFDNSEDSRHEMNLGSYQGIILGGDVLSDPPGIAIVLPGDWDNSKLRARLRNNRMPPGWEFDIEETNRDGPIVTVGTINRPSTGADCDIYAVDLIGAWVDAGATESSFPFTSLNDEACIGDFANDVLPLFTTEGAWFEGSQACTECHFDNSEDSRHEMNLGSYQGIMLGGDVLSDPPGVAIVIPGNWSDSKLRARLRNNRMPPGWEFDIEETNRDGPLLEHDGGNVYAVELIGAWVNAGATDGDFAWTDTDGSEHNGSFESDVLPLFTTENAWFEGSQACTECHFDNSEDSRHEMNLGSYQGIMLGGDVLSDPPGVPIVLAGDWENSKLRARLRNNRMPPGWEFDIEETNRDGPIVTVGTFANAVAADSCEVYAVDLIGAWVDAGAPELDPFAFTDSNDLDCAGSFDADILPLFSTENAWFEGSQACTECHFDNSEDSRHEMDLSSYAGIMLGGDVLSDPPGVAIIIPGNWSDSKLRARLRNNRMPPGWEFDIEETNRDGPLLEHDGGNVYAVELIGAWVDAGAPDGDFGWSDTDGAEHNGSFENDVLPLFTTENAWFEGSQACTECHFDNSEDSRHEMNLGSYEGIMLGGDVLSDPPGVAIIIPGNWSDSKLRARLRNNRMPPGWEFDIEETNRDGPLVLAGYPADSVGPVLVSAEVVTEETAVADTAVEPVEIISTIDEAGTSPIPPEIPAPTITETVMEPSFRPMFLALFGLLTVVFGVAIGFSSAVQLRKPETQNNRTDYARNIAFLLFAILAVFSAGLALHATITDTFTRTTIIHEEVPLPINMVPEIPRVPEVRLEEWQAKIPPAYAPLTNPFADDPAAVFAGKAVYEDHDCYECHGENLDGQGNFSEGLKPRPVNLTDPALMNLPFITDAYLFWRISEGGSQSPFFSAMPAWKAYLTETERWQLIAYIRSQVGTQLSESDQAAIAVIEQAGCFACHRIEAMGRGGKIGPGWDEVGEMAGTRVSGMSGEEYIRQSILDPQAFTVPGFEDQANTMPADFGEKLTPEEIDLLVNFLTNLSFDDD